MHWNLSQKLQNRLYLNLAMGLGRFRGLGRFFQQRLKNTQKHIEFVRNRLFPDRDLGLFGFVSKKRAFHMKILHKSIENDRNLSKKTQNQRRCLAQENSSEKHWKWQKSVKKESNSKETHFTREFFIKASQESSSQKHRKWKKSVKKELKSKETPFTWEFFTKATSEVLVDFLS